MVLRFSLLAVVFLLACTNVERDSPYDSKRSINYDCGDDAEELELKFSDPRDKKVYNAIEFKVRKACWDKTGTVVTEDSVYKDITWMAQNLNYDAPGSVCYDNNEANCETYGRLYNFETAKTACPPGWRLPISGEENSVFGYSAYYVIEALGYENCYTTVPGDRGVICVGRWLGLGGLGYSNDNFSDLDSTGYWWTSTEGKANNAYSLHGQIKENPQNNGSIYYYSDLKKSLDEKSYFLSVRCVQD